MPIDYNNQYGLPFCCGDLLAPKRPFTCPTCNSTYDADEVVAEIKRLKAERIEARKAARQQKG